MLGAVVAEAAERHGDAICAVDADGVELTFTELHRRSDARAVALLEAGVAEGDAVVIDLGPELGHLVTYAALAKVGAVTAAINHHLPRDARRQLAASLVPVLVVDTTVDAELTAQERAGERPPPLADDPDRSVAIVFTSGTTGPPRAATFGGRQLEFIRQVDTGGVWGGGGPALAGTSLAHLGPMTKLPGNLTRGATMHLTRRWRAADALEITARLGMAAVGGIPTQIALMLRDPDFDRYDLSTVRAVVMGGAPAPPSLVREARGRFGAPVSTRYSCTEAGIGLGTGLADPPQDAEVSVGRPHAGVDLSLRDPDDPSRPVPPGAVGEVCLRSPAQMTGYWREPALTAERLTADGFIRTGDLGRLDDLGRLVLAGRRSEMYIRGGYNVHPVEVESHLTQLPGVADAAVVGMPDDVMGEVGVAFIVPADNEAPPDLLHLRDRLGTHLARHQLPERLVILDSLPLTAADKVDRAALRRLAAPPRSGQSLS